MGWMIGVVGTNLFFTATWAVVARWPHLGARPWQWQLGLLPAVYAMNVWYAWSVGQATVHRVPLPVVQLWSVAAMLVFAGLGGWLVVGQPLRWHQVVGGLLTLAGVWLAFGRG